MSEEAAPPTYGAGRHVTKVVPRKRLRAAHRRYQRAGGIKSLRKWALNGSGMPELAQKWLRNKRGQ